MRSLRSALSRRLPRDRSPVVGLVVLALIGLALTAVDFNELGLSWSHIRTALGESFIVAAALGLTVDFFYKRALARDAFEASLGYLLPEELKDELRWIYAQHIICVEHQHQLTVRWVDDEVAPGPRRVRVDYELFRTMRNVSSEPFEHPTFASVEEWFRGEPSDVDLVEAVVRGKRYVGGMLVTRDVDAELPDAEASGSNGAPLAPSQLDDTRPGVERTMEHRILLEPGEEVTFRYRGHEIHYESGAFHDNYGAPTIRPVVTVRTPPELRAVVSFANRGRAQATELGDRHVLPTVLLPYQPIVIRWWPADKHDEWRRAYADRMRTQG
ncbi:MAG TPA: hypothetical protein VHR88_08825 [Solirubrobacteraceae bacterium]|nr:hypothetical protein [Solirubrobacteraceae bacterium]